MKLLFYGLFFSSLLFSCFPKTGSSSLRQSYIITSPEIAEIYALIGNLDQVIGVSEQCDFPPKYLEKEKVGGFGNINLEKILKLKPKIVFTSLIEQKMLAEKLKNFDLQVYSFQAGKIEDIFSIILEIGKITHNQKRAEFVADSLEKVFAKIKTFPKLKQKVYVEIYPKPLMSFSDSSFVGQVFYYAGLQNIFPNLQREYCKIKAEEVIKRNPDIIFITYPNMPKSEIMNRFAWQNIAAIKEEKIFDCQDINPDLILRSTPRFFEGIKKIRELVCP